MIFRRAPRRGSVRHSGCAPPQARPRSRPTSTSTPTPTPTTTLPPDTRFARFLLLAYLPLALFSISHHEMWRDELHCWLVARDSPMPWDVVSQRAYDGQPPLWYLLLWVLQKTTHDPRSMQALHVAIAAAVVWVFASRAPFSRPVRALFPFGYFLAYEYVAISRCYGLALLFALLLCVRHPRRFERPWPAAWLLVALALTTTVATMVAAAYAVGLFVERVEKGLERAPVPRAGWIPIAAAAAGCLGAALCSWPPADSTVAHVGWPPHLLDAAAPVRLIEAMAPVPRVDFFFWNSSLLLSWEPFARVALPASVVLGGWLVFVLSCDRVAMVTFTAGALLLTALFGFVYPGDVRHHGFLFVLFVVAAWLVRAGAPRGEETSLRARGPEPTLAAVMVVHVAAAPIALYYDFEYVFSSGARAAQVLRERGLDGSLLVAEMDYPATAVLGHLGCAVAYTPRTGHPFSFVKWTRDRLWDPTDEQTLAFAARLGASQGRDATLVMNRPLVPALVDGAAVQRVAELYDSMIEAENFYVYRVARDRSAATVYRSGF
jgi:hypothetical protein